MAPRIEFMHAPRGSSSRGTNAPQRTEGGIFWWSIGITLLLGMATFSWFFCIYVFTHPEQPFNYSLLNRMNKIEPLQNYNEKNPPSGKTFEKAKTIYDTFYAMSEQNLAQQNSELRRGYITNFRDQKAIFLRGKYKVIHSRPLTQKDPITSGVVARAVAIGEGDRAFPNVIVEFILPTESPTLPQFAPGDILELDTPRARKIRTLWTSVMNIHRQQDDTLVFSVVPLTYGKIDIDPANHLSIVTKPPMTLNLKANWPVTDDAIGATVAVASISR